MKLAASVPTTDGSESLATDTSRIAIPSYLKTREALRSANPEQAPMMAPGSS